MLNKSEICVANSIQPYWLKSVLWWVNFSGCSALGDDDMFCHDGVAYPDWPLEETGIYMQVTLW